MCRSQLLFPLHQYLCLKCNIIVWQKWIKRSKMGIHCKMSNLHQKECRMSLLPATTIGYTSKFFSIFLFSNAFIRCCQPVHIKTFCLVEKQNWCKRQLFLNVILHHVELWCRVYKHCDAHLSNGFFLNATLELMNQELAKESRQFHAVLWKRFLSKSIAFIIATKITITQRQYNLLEETWFSAISSTLRDCIKGWKLARGACAAGWEVTLIFAK